MNKIYLKELYLTYPIKDLFHTLTKNLVVKIDEKEYPNFIFFFNKDNNCIFEYNTKNGDFWCNYKLYWSIFYEKFNFNYKQIRDITKDMVENHFNLKGITPVLEEFQLLQMVENHFNLKGITPLLLVGFNHFVVENHFNLKGITPGGTNWNPQTSVENHFNLKGITPKDTFKATEDPVENHFKLKGITPLWMGLLNLGKVENHFKLKGITPPQTYEKANFMVENHFNLKGIKILKYFITFLKFFRNIYCY